MEIQVSEGSVEKSICFNFQWSLINQKEIVNVHTDHYLHPFSLYAHLMNTSDLLHDAFLPYILIILTS